MLLMLCEYDVHLVDRQFSGLTNKTNRLEDVRCVGVSRAIAKGQDNSVQFLLVSYHVYRSLMESRSTSNLNVKGVSFNYANLDAEYDKPNKEYDSNPRSQLMKQNPYKYLEEHEKESLQDAYFCLDTKGNEFSGNEFEGKGLSV